jgi:NADH-quinone oxidoreductase subunit J
MSLARRRLLRRRFPKDGCVTLIGDELPFLLPHPKCRKRLRCGGDFAVWLKGLFLLVAVLSVLGALGMLATPNPVHSVLYLVLTLFCVAAIYLMLGAEFLAVVQVIVYAGAIMVLFLFVIMLLNLGRDEFGADPLPRQWTAGLFVCGGVAVVMVAVGLSALLGWRTDPLQLVSLKDLSRLLFTKHLLAFEIASLILLIGMVGVVVMVKRPKEGA